MRGNDAAIFFFSSFPRSKKEGSWEKEKDGTKRDLTGGCLDLYILIPMKREHTKGLMRALIATGGEGRREEAGGAFKKWHERNSILRGDTNEWAIIAGSCLVYSGSPRRKKYTK